MSAHLLLNLSNKLRKKDKMLGLPSTSSTKSNLESTGKVHRDFHYTCVHV